MDLRFVVSRLYLAKELVSLPNHLASIHNTSICHVLCLIRCVLPQLPHSADWSLSPAGWLPSLFFQWERNDHGIAREIENLCPSSEFLLLWGHFKDGSERLWPRGAGQLKNSVEWGYKNGLRPKCYKSFPSSQAQCKLEPRAQRCSREHLVQLEAATQTQLYFSFIDKVQVNRAQGETANQHNVWV